MRVSNAAQGYLRTKNIESADAPVYKGDHGREATRVIMMLLFCTGVIGCCQPNDPNCRNVSFGPSGAEVAGVAIGVGVVAATAIALEVHHVHHTLNGCVADGPGGKQLKTHSGKVVYLLSGSIANISAGRRVGVHGTKVKQQKHSTAQQAFIVERLLKDYGPC